MLASVATRRVATRQTSGNTGNVHLCWYDPPGRLAVARELERSLNKIRRAHHTISRLPSCARHAVDRMLDCGETYAAITTFINAFGYQVSPSSVARYAKHRSARQLRMRALASTVRATAAQQVAPRRRHFKMADLPEDTRRQVDRMLLDGRTYLQVHDWVNDHAPHPGWSVSPSAVARYARMARTTEDISELLRMEAFVEEPKV